MRTGQADFRKRSWGTAVWAIPLLAAGLGARGQAQSEFPEERRGPNVILPSSQFGVRGEGPGELLRPGGIAFGRDDRIWVCDSGNHRIQVFTPEGKRLAGWGKPGSAPGEFLFPRAVALAPGGEVFVADTGNSRIQVFDDRGTFLRQFGRAGIGPGEFARPVGLAVAADRLFVVDEAHPRVQAFTFEGRLISSFGGFGDQPGQFREPAGLAVDDRGRLYVSDAGNHRIEVFDFSGGFLKQWGAWGLPAGFLASPQGLAVSQGRLYACDFANHRIEAFDLAGTFLFQWGAPPAASRAGEGRLHFPAAISIDPAGGRAVVVEPVENRCQVYPVGISPKATPVLDLPFWDSYHARLHGNMLPALRESSGQVGNRWERNPPVLAGLLESEAHSALFFDISLRPCFLINRAGSMGRRLGEFRWPVSLAADASGSRFLVVDRGNRRVETMELPRDVSSLSGFARSVRFVLGFDPVAQVPRSLEGYHSERAWLSGVCQDADGNFCVADGLNAAILVCDRQGRFLRALRPVGEGSRHRWGGLAASPDGKTLYVADREGFQILVVGGDGALRGRWGRRGSGPPDGFLAPSGVAVDQEGFVYVVDSELDVVKKFTAAGDWVAQWGGTGSELGRLWAPEGIAFIGPDRIVVDDAGNHRGQVYTRKGEFLVAFYKGGRSSPSGR